MKTHTKKLVALTILSSFLSTNLCLAQSFPQQYSNDVEAQLEQILEDSQTQASEIPAPSSLKAGQNFAIELIDDIDSQNAAQGDEISAKLLFPIETDGQIIIPEGSVVKGSITKFQKTGGWYKNAQAEVVFTQIECQDDYKLPIVAKIKTKDDSGILFGANGVERLGKIFSALLTTSLGGVFAGLGIGLMGPYALAGAVIGGICGATIGSGWLFFQKGKPINIPSGTKLIITLQNDVAVNGFDI